MAGELPLGLEEVLRAMRGLDRAEVTLWVERRWVRPEGETPPAWRFDAADQARLALLLELRRDLELADDTLALVLSLLDQLYTTRRRLTALARAMQGQPEGVREAVREAIGREITETPRRH